MFAGQDCCCPHQPKDTIMSSLDFDFDVDARMHELELEWREAYEKSVAARTDHLSLMVDPSARPDVLDRARERLERAEAANARVMAKIERLEAILLGG
jgi:hypothetical protein